MIGTQAEYARHLGVKPPYISKLVKQGKIPRRDDGKIDFAEADHARGVTADPARAIDTTGLDPKRPEEQTFTTVRIERETYQAQLSKLELDKALGRVLPKRGVEEGMISGARTISEQLGALVNRADEIEAVAREGGVKAVRAFLLKAVRELQQTTSDALTRVVQEIMTHEAE